MSWHLYVIRTVDGSLYAGITTSVRRRYQEHASGCPKAARFLRAKPPKELVLSRRIGSHSLALKAEYHFKQLPKHDKERIVQTGKLHINQKTGEIRRMQRPAKPVDRGVKTIPPINRMDARTTSRQNAGAGKKGA